MSSIAFAIVGDTRPANPDDTSGYPTDIIQKIWQDLQASDPRPPFAITTGDYMFANTSGSQAGPQMDLYLAARLNYSNIVFPALGNHECTGATASNCGVGNKDGVTSNYTIFLSKMLTPINQTKPYYSISVHANDATWTSKFVFVAANAWDSAQDSWLQSAMAVQTTYTFVVRHEPRQTSNTPGVDPSNLIIDQYPYTLVLAGHSHTFQYHASSREVITGNGGAPLTGSVNYGYVIVHQRNDGAIQFDARDYDTNAVFQTFAVAADGTQVP